MLAIITFFTCSVTSIYMPETYPPVLLKRKAEHVRKSTGDERYWHPHEREKINIQNVLVKHLSRPVR